MDWKTRFPVGLAIVAALMLAGGVSAATSLKLAHDKATVVLASHEQPPEPGEEDADESEPADETRPTDESEPTEESEQPQGDLEDGPAGPVARFHEGCAFPGLLVVPSGTWTHGDYVSAWAKTGDRDAHRAAAHSPCGKPMKAVEKGKDGKERQDKLFEKGRKHGGKGHHGKSGHGKSKKRGS
jgi:hypothetical protein